MLVAHEPRRPATPTSRYLVAERSPVPPMVFSFVFGAGFGEETTYRGFLFERFGRLIGARRWGMPAILLGTSPWFGFGHLADQGVPGFIQATIVGLVFGTPMAVTRGLPLLIVADAAFGLTAYALICFGRERWVAHWFDH